MDASGPIWGSLLLQLLLILINAFFAAAEIAVLSLNETKLKIQTETGDRKALLMQRMVDAPTSFLSTIQVGITFAGFLGSAFAASNFSSRLANFLYQIGFTVFPLKTLDTLCVVLITLILSFCTLVLGELVPKRIAMQRTDEVARLTIGVVNALSIVLHPLVWLLSVATNALLRLFRIDPKKQTEEVTEEEIRMMVDIGEEKGAIESNEAELIENIFEFNNLTAGDVMVHRTDITAISTNDTDDEILRTILETGFSRFPVYDEDIDNIVGTLNTREYLLNKQNPKPRSRTEITHAPYMVPETVRADVLFREMQKKKIHMAIVVDEYGGTSGLVTMEDLLEEIVGDIYDEFDPQQEQDIVQLDENKWRISGSTDLETISEALGVELPLDEEYDTLGGLVYSQLTVIPQDGATPCVDAFGLHIQVERLEDHRVESAIVSREPKRESAAPSAEN